MHLHTTNWAWAPKQSLEVWRDDISGRETVVDRGCVVRVRPWLERMPMAYGTGEVDVCWMCVQARQARSPRAAARFLNAHRYCGFLIEE